MGARVLRHEAPGGGYVLAMRPPAAALAGLVRGYEDFAEWSAAPLRRREIAIPAVVVILDLSGEGWSIGGASGAGGLERFGSFAAGLHDRATVVEHAGRARCMQLNLTPLGARVLLGRPLADLANRVVELEDVLGADTRRLVERLAGTPRAEERFALLDAVLGGRAAAAPLVRPDVAWAYRRLVETGGDLPVAVLAAELGCSRRHLTARFGEELGLPPKTFARVLRFRRAADALLGGGEERLAAIAAACGYADQSHLTREFRALAGTTPAALLRSRMPGGGGMAA